MRKRLLALLAAAALALTGIAPSAVASAVQEPQAYVFHAAGNTVPQDDAHTMYYTDDYFAVPSTTYQPSLATATLCMAMSAFGSNTMYAATPTQYDKAAANWFDLMPKLGFTGVAVNPYFLRQPDDEHVAFGIAYKMITVEEGGASRTVPLIVIGVRGSNYESEWASNVTVGANGDHAGFRSAALQILDGDSTASTLDVSLKSYIQSHPQLAGQEVKLWISGFSRAAATSNLLGGYLDDEIAAGTIQSRIGARLAKTDLYVYTFEAPAGASSSDVGDARYGNIFNLVNPNDIVPKVAPYFPGAGSAPGHDFRRYGVDRFFPTEVTDSEFESWIGAVKAAYQAMEPGGYALDKFRNWRLNPLSTDGVLFEIDQNTPHCASVFVQDFLTDLIADGIGTRETYASAYQSAFQTAMGFLCGCAKYGTKSQQKAFIEYLKANVLNELTAMVKLLVKTEKAQWSAVFTQWALGYLQSARNASGLRADDAALTRVAEALTVVLLETWRKNTSDIKSLYNNITRVATFAFNASYLLQAHDPCLCLAWLMTMDPNYAGSKAFRADRLFRCGEYRVVWVKGNVQSEVQRLTAGGDVAAVTKMDANGVVTGNDVPCGTLRESNGAGVSFLYKMYYLPVDATFLLKIYRDTADELVTGYQVTEFHPKVGDVKRLFAYTQDLPFRLLTSDYYTCLLAAYTSEQLKEGLPQGSDADYQALFHRGGSATGEAITTPFVNQRLLELRSNYTTVTAQASNSFGAVVGGGVVRQYAYVPLEALAAENGVFLGWQDDPPQQPGGPERVVCAIPSLPNEYTALFGFAATPEAVRADNTGLMGGASQATVAWQAPANVDPSLIVGYRIYRTDGTNETMQQVDASTLRYADNTVIAGTRYTYAVCALAADDRAGAPPVEGQRVSADVTIGTPWRLEDAATGIWIGGYSAGGPAPTALTVTATVQESAQNRKMRVIDGARYLGSYTIAIDSAAFVVDGYAVGGLPAAGLADGVAITAQHDPNPADSGLSAEALEGVVAGERAVVHTDTLALGQFYLTTAQLPGTPQQVAARNSATAPAATEVTVTWAAPAIPAAIESYTVYRDQLLVATVAADAPLRYVDRSGLIAGQTYAYRIAANNLHGEGQMSGAASVAVGYYWSFTEGGVTASGYSYGNAPTGIRVTALPEGDPQLRHFTVGAGETVVGRYEVAFFPATAGVVGGSKIAVSFPLSAQREGAGVRVQHDLDASGAGRVESFSVPVIQSYCTVAVDALSPFLLTAARVVPPKTGDQTPLAALLALMALSLLPLALRKRRRGRRE